MDRVLASSPPNNGAVVGVSRARVWTGRVLTGLIVAFLLIDAVMKIIPLALVVEASQKLGFSVDVIRPLASPSTDSFAPIMH